MIPLHHPPATTASGVDESTSAALWCPDEYGIDDDRLERWIIDQVQLSALTGRAQLRILGDLARVVGALRDAVERGVPLAEAVATATPAGDTRAWRSFAIGDAFQVWRQGRHGWALEVRAAADGTVRWRAGHSFRPFVSCHTRLEKGIRHCLQYAAVMVPRCLKHADRAFLENLKRDGLVETSAGAGEPDAAPLPLLAAAAAAPGPNPDPPSLAGAPPEVLREAAAKLPPLPGERPGAPQGQRHLL